MCYPNGRGSLGSRGSWGAAGRSRGRASAGVQDVDDEDEGRAGRDGAGVLVAVAELGRDDHEHLAADVLAHEAGLPALDDLPGADVHRERGAAARPGGVEGGAVPQPAAVLHKDAVALDDLRALALQHRLGDELGDRKSTRLNSSHVAISYAVFCL